MKILMLLENEFRKDGRVEKEIHTLFQAGHEVIVAAINISGLPAEEKREECTVLRKNISKFTVKSSVGALKVPLYFNFWRSYVRAILKHHKIDAIHIHDLPLCRIGTEVKKQYNIKLVIDLHENWPALLNVSAHTGTFLGKILSTEKQWRSYEKKCAVEANAIVTVVNEMKERISKQGIPPAKIFILENTPETGAVSELKYERDPDYFTLIYVGGISLHRGLQYVIDGIKLLVPELPVRLWIAGDGKHVPSLKEQVSNLNLQNYVKFFGMVTRAESEDLMKKANLGLIPHIRSEQSDNSSPNKLFEYMAAGLPVLASDCISVRRVLAETNSGTTYIFDSPSDFARVVKDLYSEPEKSDTFAANGIRAVRDKYNWQQGSAALIRLYSGLQ
jgi:glycosyltransferase involved in cell wall biosynthesis